MTSDDVKAGLDFLAIGSTLSHWLSTLYILHQQLLQSQRKIWFSQRRLPAKDVHSIQFVRTIELNV